MILLTRKDPSLFLRDLEMYLDGQIDSVEIESKLLALSDTEDRSDWTDDFCHALTHYEIDSDAVGEDEKLSFKNRIRKIADAITKNDRSAFDAAVRAFHRYEN